MELQSVEVEAEPWGDDDISKIVYSGARAVRGRFSNYVELEDMIQEAWLAVYSSPKMLAEWQGQGEAGKGRLRRAVMKSCSMYAQKQKAAKLGYRVGDLFFYGPSLLRHAISLVLDTVNTDERFEGFRDRAMFLDVEQALLTLSDADYQILWWAFKGDLDEEEGYALVGGNLGLSNDAARQRVNRILRKVQTCLGGENPAPRLASRSNAQALAELRTQWEGEG